MTIGRFYTLLFLFFFFLLGLVGEYFACEIYFRLTRPSDQVLLDGLSVFFGFGGCFLLVRKVIPIALKDGIPRWVVAAFFVLFSVLLGLFSCFSLQLLNGAFDFSDSEPHRVVVTEKTLSAFGGSVAEGINPIAHLVYYKDWDPNGHVCVLLAPQDFYYSVDVGTAFQINIRQGLFHWPWVQAYTLLGPQQPT